MEHLKKGGSDQLRREQLVKMAVNKQYLFNISGGKS